MPARNLAGDFSKRMLPLSIFAALVIMVVPPLTYHFTNQNDLTVQAEIYAKLLASDLGNSADADPLLWQYRVNKILMFTSKHRFQKDIGTVLIRACNGNIILNSARLGIGTGKINGPAARVPITTRGIIIGSAEIIMDPSEYGIRIRHIAIESFAVALLLFLLLYFFPTHVVKKQAEKLEQAGGKLQIAKVQEQERRRIARDLHDGVGQALAALQIELKLARSRPDKSDKHVAQASLLTENVLNEIRAAVLALRPTAFNRESLELVIRNYMEEFEMRNQILSSLRIRGDLNNLPPDTAVLIFRIFQESLTNILRHAKASEIGVTLEVSGNLFTMSISDDGMGFDPSKIATGTGIKGISERLELCNGKMQIDSLDSIGTALKFSIPLRSRR